ncbi:MAG: hypothetical protein P0Y65_13010 [Candidatus Devosia phytovorans]|uniref:Uncharacterized protein n=1 Tax=Candidatus Devosia phytovorans TaxID=3121372 RepID=A0AAJ5VS17_9HYPH|nr:hypothetical protein [Devosia sp.]WEK03121.1 MAG: hypothetical protein P0Y65_13010 [Devosia sp.]
MRILITLLVAFFALPALAQQSEHYSNARFGFGMDIPYGFVPQGESDNADGAQFAHKGKPVNLMVWGGNLAGDFESEAQEAMSYSVDADWNIEGQSVTPQWANFTAIQGFRKLYQRMVLLCGGTSYAAVRVEYSVAEAGKMDSVIENMAASLRAESCS